jgi:hypothetical protein
MQLLPEMMAPTSWRELNVPVFTTCIKASSATINPVAAFPIEAFGVGNKDIVSETLIWDKI